MYGWFLVSMWLHLLAAIVWSALWPDGAAACSVCYAGAEESRKAFLLTTLFLSVLPLAMFASLFWWFRRRFREIEQTSLPVGSETETRSGSPQIG